MIGKAKSKNPPSLFWPVLLIAAGSALSFTTIPSIGSRRPFAGDKIQSERPSVLKSEAGTSAASSSSAKSICTFDEADFSGRTSWPYSAADLNRLDNSDDSSFYESPRLVTHIDDAAIRSLSNFYRSNFEELANASKDGQKTIDILDLCSSWISHLPLVDSDSTFRYGNVVGLGMNQKELEENRQLTGNILQDLNLNPELSSLEDESFDFVTMTVSIDYLIKPLEVVQEIQRVLKSGGSALISFGDRCFPTKAVAMWLQADSIERITIVASYFHYAQYKQEGNAKGVDESNDERAEDLLFRWKSIECFDLKDDPLEMPTKPSMGELLSNPALGLAWMNSAAAVQKANGSDQLFVIKATKE